MAPVEPEDLRLLREDLRDVRRIAEAAERDVIKLGIVYVERHEKLIEAQRQLRTAVNRLLWIVGAAVALLGSTRPEALEFFRGMLLRL